MRIDNILSQYKEINLERFLMIEEGVSLKTSNLETVLRHPRIDVGFELEFHTSRKGEPNFFQHMGKDPSQMYLRDISQHPFWEEDTFDNMYGAHVDEQSEKIRADNYDEIYGKARETIKNTYRAEYRKMQVDAYRKANPEATEGMEDDEVWWAIPEDEEDAHSDAFSELYTGEAEDEMDSIISAQVDSEEDYWDEHYDSILNEMSIDPDEEDEDAESDLDATADHFSDNGWPMDVVSEQAVKIQSHEWGLMRDASSDLELVTPAFPTVQAGLQELKKLFQYIGQHHSTTSDDGLHCTLKYQGAQPTDVNLVKLGLFLGEDYVLQLFGRTGSRWAYKQENNLTLLVKNYLKENGGTGRVATDSAFLMKFAKEIDGQFGDELKKTVMTALDYGLDKLGQKYRTFNIESFWRKGLIEFRAMGNEDYTARYDDVYKTVLRYAFVLNLAFDPNAERQEYLKKLAKLFEKAAEAIVQDEEGDEMEAQGSLVDLPTFNDMRQTIRGPLKLDWARYHDRYPPHWNLVTVSNWLLYAHARRDEANMQEMVHFWLWLYGMRLDETYGVLMVYTRGLLTTRMTQLAKRYLRSVFMDGDMRQDLNRRKVPTGTAYRKVKELLEAGE